MAEVLVSIALVGIIAAVMLPMINKYKPDVTKVKFLRTYDAINLSLAQLASNEKIYPRDDVNDPAVDYLDAPFYNTVAVTLGDGTNFSGDARKLCELLAVNMSAMFDKYECSEVYNDYTASNEFKKSFLLQNGVELMITTDTDNISKYQTDVIMDINGEEALPNCIWNQSTCKKPDRFKLMINGAGDVFAGDPVSKDYLDNRLNWKYVEKRYGDIDLDEFENVKPEVAVPL